MNYYITISKYEGLYKKIVKLHVFVYFLFLINNLIYLSSFFYEILFTLSFLMTFSK